MSSSTRPHRRRSPVVASPLAGEPWWSRPQAEVLEALGTTREGLTPEQATTRLVRFGPNVVREHRAASNLEILWSQVKSPLVLLLVGATMVSAVVHDVTDSLVILAIVVASVGVGYARERSAASAIRALSSRLRLDARVVRAGRERRVPVAELVPGDVILLSAGALVVADALLLDATDFFVDQSALTGETFPVEKGTTPSAREAAITERGNAVFMGTHARSGTARAVIVETGATSAYGEIAARLAAKPPATEFDQGLTRFGWAMTVTMSVMTFAVFAVNVAFGRHLVEALLFAVALAVGLTPELLPAILSVNLSRGAHVMARHGVLVRHLASIENLGSVDVLCTDKTGTLTEGSVRLEGAYGSSGASAAEVLDVACQNAGLQSGIESPLDAAILARARPGADVEKLGEVPYDFVRKRLSVAVRTESGARLITKGAFDGVLDVCAYDESGEVLDDAGRERLREHFSSWSRRGFRVLGVATRDLGAARPPSRDDERAMRFVGFLTFFDPPKRDAASAIEKLRALGVRTKVISGDGALVTAYVAELVGIDATRVLTGAEMKEMPEEALWHAVDRVDVFAEVEPNQKERVIRALSKIGHVVGFLGDGINDAPALHAADAGISVESAADVAREAADFVLLRPDLDAIRTGVLEGRTTFANTLKYVYTTTSANLGNMVSMAAASFFLPFLPLLASQILLNNFLSDLPGVALARDRVDPEILEHPRRWDMAALRRFMVAFGLVSSAFDLATFAVLLWVFRLGAPGFRTGWFVESLLTELAVALVVRTRRPAYRSPPGRLLVISTVAVGALTLVLPYLPLAGLFEFVPLAPALLFTVIGITAAYVLATELLKRPFYRFEDRRELRKQRALYGGAGQVRPLTTRRRRA